MDYSTSGILAILVILVVLVVVTVPVRRKPTLRRIAAYARLPHIVGRTVESDRRLHVSLGGAGLGGESTMIALAAAELAYQLARRAAVGDRSPLVSTGETSAVPLAQDALRRAYYARGLRTRYNPSGARWYPAGGRALAFAAALSAMQGDERIGGNVLAGTYGAELALVMTSAGRMDIPTVAVSDRIDGQAVAYAMTDLPLIGEEVFVSAAYLEDDASPARVALTLDVMRYLLIGTMLFILILSVRG